MVSVLRTSSAASATISRGSRNLHTRIRLPSTSILEHAIFCLHSADDASCSLSQNYSAGIHA